MNGLCEMNECHHREDSPDSWHSVNSAGTHRRVTSPICASASASTKWRQQVSSGNDTSVCLYLKPKGDIKKKGASEVADSTVMVDTEVSKFTPEEAGKLSPK